ncbi:hypothetical protein L3X38_021015 [Prunus dulcis]|uniref:Uncharacterized protein n=1 Tax=Prunus dulcis TaxID=3755 RepID=A0AAD4VUU0_PRUDU|nr:hypothetical protein L3X38_021015 [Prunus dulcis]
MERSPEKVGIKHAEENLDDTENLSRWKLANCNRKEPQQRSVVVGVSPWPKALATLKIIWKRCEQKRTFQIQPQWL